MGHYASFVISSWQDATDGTMHWSVRRAGEQEPLQLPDGSFVIRTWIDDEQTVRGLIRHAQSGSEMQFQSSQRAIEFIRTWIQSNASTTILPCEYVQNDLPEGKSDDG